LPGVPKVLASGQAGLLDIVLDPQFAANHRVYLTYHEARASGSGISVYRATLDETSGPALLDGRAIFRAEPSLSGTTNVGSRLAFLGDGTLIVSVGDRFKTRDEAQNLGSDLGKLLRITVDGQIPPDNPFEGVAGARGEIWSLGHRNPQGLAFDAATGTLWEVEHGARGGDELNRPVAGRNYGWPVITYGIDYSGFPIGKGLTRQEGLEQPVYYWDPVIAPSGLVLYQADLFPSWKGNLFVGGLRGEHLDRLVVQGGRVVGEERLLTELGERVRDVKVGPEGALYVLTDNPRGRVLKLVPAGK
jgi:glucose/arabinose dehydrogenase